MNSIETISKQFVLFVTNRLLPIFGKSVRTRHEFIFEQGHSGFFIFSVYILGRRRELSLIYRVGMSAFHRKPLPILRVSFKWTLAMMLFMCCKDERNRLCP